ncbi:cysteine desulfurase family protein [Pigmentibacter sp. JX0631]|uniref:cysteine desulfurase family protein n=1 Tax=Pigmentibacter sp. JX0631 TaxID=2976982 RepID=UPI0024687F49|nr:cysteine desulfurase family protein [Pigmentibacter sp. JX0631]WGL59649.1 cysteine desulfurase family protein [Pigmentibacter sp. JX0631]
MKHIYLDHNATSPSSDEHLSSLFLKLKDSIGNPSSPHSKGRNASVCLTEARKAIANSLSVDVGEIIFLSGATEANNIATIGVLNYTKTPMHSQHVITSSIEHPAIKEPILFLKNSQNLQVTELNVSFDGFIQIEDIIKNIKPETTLLTIMAANNEIGTIQPVKFIGDYLHYMRWGIVTSQTDKETFDLLTTNYLNSEITKEHLQKIHFHVDAVQAYGKIELENWFSFGHDSVSISGHKVGSLQGIGALFLRRGRKYLPLILGGAQEKNRRAGTENLPGIISFGLIAKDLYSEHWRNEKSYITNLRDTLLTELSKLPNIELNTPINNILPNTVNFSVQGKKLKGEDLLVELDLQGICASSGSACSSGANLPSKVILALGKETSQAKNTIRLSLAYSNTKEEIEKTLSIIKNYLSN